MQCLIILGIVDCYENASLKSFARDRKAWKNALLYPWNARFLWIQGISGAIPLPRLIWRHCDIKRVHFPQHPNLLVISIPRFWTYLHVEVPQNADYDGTYLSVGKILSVIWPPHPTKRNGTGYTRLSRAPAGTHTDPHWTDRMPLYHRPRSAYPQAIVQEQIWRDLWSYVPNDKFNWVTLTVVYILGQHDSLPIKRLGWGNTLPGMKRPAIVAPSGGVLRGIDIGTGG
jgi:hypothetical protein